MLPVSIVNRIESDYFPLWLTLFSTLLLWVWVKGLQKIFENGLQLGLVISDTQRGWLQEESWLDVLQVVGQRGMLGSLWPAGEGASQLQAHFFPHVIFLKLCVWNIVTNGDHRE